MKPVRECTTCGKVFTNQYKLYRHTIHMHNPRFCRFCDHKGGRPRILRRHVKKKHPGVDVDTMTNEEFWRSVEDAIIPAPEAMIMVPVPMALPPEAEVEIGEVAAEVELGVVPAEVELREVAVEAVVEETSAAEAVVDELSVEEVVTHESSGLWREVEIDISEPLAVVSMEVEGRSPMTMEDKGPEDRCARALSLEKYRAWFMEKRQVGVATLVGAQLGFLPQSYQLLTPTHVEWSCRPKETPGRLCWQRKRLVPPGLLDWGKRRLTGKTDQATRRRPRNIRARRWGCQLVVPPYRPCCHRPVSAW